MRIDYIGDQVDTTAPVVEATVTGSRNGVGEYLGRATLTLSASDSSGVAKTEYSLDGGATWITYSAPVAFTTRGAQTVRYRATDRAATPNTSTAEQVSFTVVAGESCLPALSDEFTSGTLNTSRWSFLHSTTPTTGARAPSVADGSLVLPLGAYSLDLTRPGPAGLVGQPLPTGDFTLVAKISAPGLNTDISGQGSQYAQVGLKIFQTNDNWIKVAHTRNADNNPTGSANTYFEFDTETGGTRVLGTRMGLAAPATNLPTWWMRVVRTGSSVSGSYSLSDPDGAGANWVSLGASVNVDTLLPPASGPRYIAAYGGNGSISARFDYLRFTPDQPVDTAPPTTSRTVAPAAPDGAGGWYRSPVMVTLQAGDDGECVSGVARTEYRVDNGAFATYTAPFSVPGDGTHTVEYRSVDSAGNTEAAKSLTVKLDATAPATTAALDPASPGPGGTYGGTVRVGLTSTDASSGVALTEYQVDATGPFSGFAAPRVAAEWLPYDAANKPNFASPGAYTISYRSTDAAGNVEATKTVAFAIAAPTGDTIAPVTTGTLDPTTPGAGFTYAAPVTVKFSANDPVAGGPAARNFDVDAAGTVWSPTALSLVAGDSITWRFGPSAGSVHDVWLVAPGGNPSPTGTDLTKVSDLKFPGDPPVSRTLTQTGSWTFLCKLHATFSGGVWTGMTGTAVVSAAPAGSAPSGVDFTEYRIKTGTTQGDWVKTTNAGAANPFASQVTVSAEGQHTVEYRSTDKAGNVEATKSVAFAIATPEPGFPIFEAFADPATGAAPLETRFSASGVDPDGGALSYRWEFADGSYVGRAVSRTYTKPGTYTVKVTATDDEGDTSAKTVTVTVTAPGVLPPTVDATADRASGPARLTVQFGATGADPDGPASALQYAWDFGDGVKSFEQNPTHTYAQKGSYTAKVTVSDGGGATATKTIAITVADPAGNVAPFVDDTAVFADGLTATFTVAGSDPDGDAVTYEWDFADGSPKGSGSEVEHTYTHAGTYPAKVTLSDGHGGATTATVAVTIVATANGAPTAEIAADPLTGTAPLAVQFSAHASDPEHGDMTYVWAFGDGGFSAEPNPRHSYLTPGTYTATLTVTDDRGAKATTTRQVVVTAAAAAPLAAPKGVDAAPTAPAQAPWFGVAKPAATSVAAFSRSGLAVKVTCTEAMRGSATITVSKKVAKALGLRKTTLAAGTVSCARAGSKSVTLKASAAVKRALKKAKGSVKATLGVSLRAAGKPASKATRGITLARS